MPAKNVERVTVSLQPRDLETLRAFAVKRHGGNVSAAVAELVSWTRLKLADGVSLNVTKSRGAMPG
jgi:hypothetical protein